MIRFTDIDELRGIIRYPLPPTLFHKWADEMDIYVRFMRQVRMAICSSSGQKVYRAIQISALESHRDEADVAMILVDLGLRATREAFPAGFLMSVDTAVCRMGMWGEKPTRAILDLITCWRTEELPKGGFVAPVPPIGITEQKITH